MSGVDAADNTTLIVLLSEHDATLQRGGFVDEGRASTPNVRITVTLVGDVVVK